MYIGGPQEYHHGIHISAQLLVEASQLRSYNIAWAAITMERAAERINWLEDQLRDQKRKTHESIEVQNGNVG